MDIVQLQTTFITTRIEINIFTRNESYFLYLEKFFVNIRGFVYASNHLSLE